jgi:selenocysteine lyase/cysteine desulfurase
LLAATTRSRGNTTEGINLVAEGFLARGDNLATPADEFPSNQYPWMNLRAASSAREEQRRPSALDALAAACDRRTRLTVSWGARQRLAERRRRTGGTGTSRALTCFSMIQGLGMFPLHVHGSGVDFLAADGHCGSCPERRPVLLCVASI